MSRASVVFPTAMGPSMVMYRCRAKETLLILRYSGTNLGTCCPRPSAIVANSRCNHSITRKRRKVKMRMLRFTADCADHTDYAEIL